MTKTIQFLLASFILVTSFTVTACSQTGDDVTVEEAKKMIDQEEVFILDVRTPEEFEAGHIEGAVNINVYDDQFTEQVKQIETKKPILVYCRSGARSKRAQGMMQNMGMKRVMNMQGGIGEWTSEGYPAVR